MTVRGQLILLELSKVGSSLVFFYDCVTSRGFSAPIPVILLSSLTRHEVMTSIEVYDVIIDRTILYPCNKSQGDKIYKKNDDLVTKS